LSLAGIVFGDINDPGEPGDELKADPRNYGVLSELGTRPRTNVSSGAAHPNPNLKNFIARRDGDQQRTIKQ